MADQARNKKGLGKAVAFNVITPMNRVGMFIVMLVLSYLDRNKRTQQTAARLSFLPFVHWVVVKREKFFNGQGGRPERLNYDYLFFLSTFNGPWRPYIEAYSDVLYLALDLVWFWSIGYPFARPCNKLVQYIERNRIESEHFYSAYPGASVRDVRAAVDLRGELEKFARVAAHLSPHTFTVEFDRLLVRTENMLGTFGTRTH